MTRCARPFAKDALNFSRNSHRLLPPKCTQSCRCLPIQKFSQPASSIFLKGKETNSGTSCTSIFCGCVAKTRASVNTNQVDWTEPFWDQGVLHFVISATDMQTIDCSS